MLSIDEYLDSGRPAKDGWPPSGDDRPGTCCAQQGRQGSLWAGVQLAVHPRRAGDPARAAEGEALEAEGGKTERPTARAVFAVVSKGKVLYVKLSGYPLRAHTLHDHPPGLGASCISCAAPVDALSAFRPCGYIQAEKVAGG